jgi:type I restriction enzyme S subunit
MGDGLGDGLGRGVADKRPLPVGWRVMMLDQVANVRSGLTVSKKKPKNPVRLPYLRVANVQAGHLDLKEVKEIEIEQHQVARYALQYGDVLMTEGGDFDKLGRGDMWQDEIPDCLHQNHVFAVRTDRKQLLPEFLNALSNSTHGRRYFLSCAKRSTNLASINLSQLRRFPVILPSLPEQRRICGVLDSWGKWQKVAEKIVVNRFDQQQGLRQALLAGEPSRSWPRRSMGEVADLVSDLVSVKQDGGRQIEYITLTDVNQGHIGPLERFVLRDAPSRARRQVREHDVLLATVRPNLQGYARIDARHADCVVSTGFAVLRPKPAVHPGYLYHYLFSPDIQSQIRAMVTGSSYPSINMGDVAGLTLALPEWSMQQRIAQILDVAGQEITLVQAQLAVLQQERALWTEQLVQGRWRVQE